MDTVANSETKIAERLSDRRRLGCSPTILTAVLLVTVLLLPAYVLSTGPVAYLVQHDVLPEELLESFYFPIAWVVRNYEPARASFIWYLSFWIDLDVNQ